MAGLLESSNGMYDIAMKPRMLRTLLKDDVPYDNPKKPLPDPSKLSTIVSSIQTFNLLSESFTSSMDPKLIQRWKSAVDDWLIRVLSLVSNFSSTPDKCWAGICLLGITCQECSSDRFMASYAVWFDKLLLHVQSPADNQFIKMASCTSLSDLMTRLAGFRNAKKDGTSHAGKLIQPILKLLQEDNSETVREAAIQLLCTVITCFPASVHRHYDSVEDVIGSKILSEKCSLNMLKRLGYCLAILPKSRGDEDTWFSLMKKILLLVNGYLAELFHGLEEGTKWEEAVRLLVPPGEAIPTTLWGQSLLEDTSETGRRRSKSRSVSTLMLSCCTMLTTSYPVQVAVPVRSLLALVERVMMVDGSVSRASSPFAVATEQEFICSELPVLHSSGLELLASVIKCMRSQLLPHAAYIVRLVKDYMKRCQLPELRTKTYSITKVLLVSMGAGVAFYLAQEVVNNALLDLNPDLDGTFSGANSKASSEALQQPFHRKRKRGTTGNLDQNSELLNLEVEAPKNHSATLVSLKVAAVGALEALLTVGGAWRSASWRAKVENLLITLAADCCKRGWANDEKNPFFSHGLASACADMQLAVLRALLASLLSPSSKRPPHLGQSLELFYRGRQETGTKLSEFCSYALLALEVLIHPRALPLADSSTNSSQEINLGFPDSLYSYNQKHSIPFSSEMLGLRHGSPDSDDDPDRDAWLSNSKETDAPATNTNSEKPSQNIEFPRQDKIFVAGGSLDAIVCKQSEPEPAVGHVEVEIENFGQSIIAQAEETKEVDGQLVSSEGLLIPATIDGTGLLVSTNNKAPVDTSMTEIGALVSAGDEAQADTAMADKHCETAPASTGEISRPTFNNLKGTASNSESDDESIPDIVDAEPDSD